MAARVAAVAAACMAAAWSGMPALAQGLPEIRTHAKNPVPACVTPDRLMQFLRTGNPGLSVRYVDIASQYKQHGERLRIRWDYAFFQMILETNYLKFKNNAGQGDVDPRQNNFAGIGTTGGGVPGDSFPDVSTGVLAQMQHLVAYSGEQVPNPVGRRTRERQDDIIQRSKLLGRAVTFKDLTRRWAVDRRYGSSIEFVASRFRATYCNGREAPEEEVAEQAPGAAAARQVAGSDQPGAQKLRVSARGRDLAASAVTESRASDQRSGLGSPPSLVAPPQVAVRPTACKVFTASYGGQKNVLIRVFAAGEMHYTALQVIDGMEERLTQSFLRTHARGGDAVGEFPSREAALVRAFDLCPMAARSE